MYLPETQGKVLPEWIDENGHMNLAYYVVLFDKATAKFYDGLEVGDAYRRSTNRTPFAAETHTLYEQELMARDAVRITTRLLAVDEKRLHYFHEMFHARDGRRVAAQEIMALHIDLNRRRTQAFEQDLRLKLEGIAAALSELPAPAGVGRRIAMPSR